jgi:gluconate 5-dehydrogenase
VTEYSANDYLNALFSLAGKVALVTGGSSGIGKGMARALAGAGATVIVLARQAEPLDLTVAEFRAAGTRAERISADLADGAAIDRAATEIVDTFGALDILVNAAGVNLRPPLAEVTSEDWDRTVAVNLAAP